MLSNFFGAQSLCFYSQSLAENSAGADGMLLPANETIYWTNYASFTHKNV